MGMNTSTITWHVRICAVANSPRPGNLEANRQRVDGVYPARGHERVRLVDGSTVFESVALNADNGQT